MHRAFAKMDAITPSRARTGHSGRTWSLFRHDLIRWSAISLVLAAAIIAVLALAPQPVIELESAVHVASRGLITIDPTFRPADHVVRVFCECSGAPLTIDYSSQGIGPVVARVRVGSWGFVRQASFFRPEQGVESYRTGQLFRLRPDGSLGEELAALQ